MIFPSGHLSGDYIFYKLGPYCQQLPVLEYTYFSLVLEKYSCPFTGSKACPPPVKRDKGFLRLNILYQIMDANFIENQNKKMKLIDDGFTFNKNRQRNDSVYWRCNMHHKTKCTSNVTINDCVTEHNHVLDAAQVEASIR